MHEGDPEEMIDTYPSYPPCEFHGFPPKEYNPV